VFTLFFGKNRPKEDKEKQLMKKKSANGRLKEEKKNQHDLPMVREIQP
jgi:hypothetical protein